MAIEVPTEGFSNVAIYTILPFYVLGMVLIGLASFWINNQSGQIRLGPLTLTGGKVDAGAQSFLGAGQGVGSLTLFFTMAASLYSGYSISGIANEAYTFGFMAIRWIPAGVALYAAFMVLAPRLHALGKSRGYLTICEFIFDRYAEPASSPLCRTPSASCPSSACSSRSSPTSSRSSRPSPRRSPCTRAAGTGPAPACRATAP